MIINNEEQYLILLLKLVTIFLLVIGGDASFESIGTLFCTLPTIIFRSFFFTL